jgi:hypothetical protein
VPLSMALLVPFAVPVNVPLYSHPAPKKLSIRKVMLAVMDPGGGLASAMLPVNRPDSTVPAQPLTVKPVMVPVVPLAATATEDKLHVPLPKVSI